MVGLTGADILDFVKNANKAWHRSLRTLYAEVEKDLKAVYKDIQSLDQPGYYPSACLLEPINGRAAALIAKLPKAFPKGIIGDKQFHILEEVLKFHKAPKPVREQAIKTFIDTELVEMQAFFDEIEINPLTPEQRLAVLTDEDATLVLAGAGSGKTSVIIAKTAYLIDRRIRRPGQILLVAFGKKAAEEIASRIRARCNVDVSALTFHGLGYKIIQAVEGRGSALAAHASDEKQFHILLRKIRPLRNYGFRVYTIPAIICLKLVSDFRGRIYGYFHA